MEHLLKWAFGAACMAGSATAETDTSWYGVIGVSSQLIDRGEQLSGPTLETVLGVERTLGIGAVYGAVYRLTPISADHEAFDEEVDYTLGYIWTMPGYVADISANWLTYPGMADAASLEIAGEVSFNTALSPTVLAFYDVDLEDTGLEGALAVENELGDWLGYAAIRIGFVHPGDDRPSRSYGGVEAGLLRKFDTVELDLFARFDAADEDSFAREIDGGTVTRMRASGRALGLRLTIAN